jgi:hypothetical protein
MRYELATSNSNDFAFSEEKISLNIIPRDRFNPMITLII